MNQGYGGGGGGGYGPPPGGGGGYGGPPGGGGGYGGPPGGGQPPGGYGPPGGQPPGYGQGPGGYGDPAQGLMGRLQVHSSFFFLAWILYFCTPKIELNGQPARRPWGTASFDLPPGNYQLRVSFPYLLMSNAGDSRLNIQIHPGQVTLTSYSAPFILFFGGTLRMVGIRPIGPPQLGR